ncbi:MAG: hypothetical protein OXC56_08385 [Chloroflexi bacterium]|nr:hypothetical protein [Chloroflexota bacterium]
MPLRPLIFLAVIATATLTLVQVEAMSVPDVSVLPAPASVAAPTLPSPAPDSAPSVTAQPAPAPGSAPSVTAQPAPAPGSAPSVTAQPAPAPGSAPSVTAQPAPAPDSAPSVTAQPAPAPAASTAPPAATDETAADAPAPAAPAPIEGLDLLEVILRISGTLTTTPIVIEAATALTEPEPAPAQPPAAALTVPEPAPVRQPAAAVTAPGTRPAAIAPGAQVTPSGGPLQPSIFERAQVVSFYGYPGVGVMGELGLHTPAGAAEAIKRLAAEYDALNGPREVLPALHLIVAVAQRHPGNDGLYLQRMDDELLNEYVEAARDAGILLFVDVQIGWSNTLTEVMILEDVLREPFVHLALDPEFATRSKGTAPGVSIGTLGSADLNAVQHYLAGLVREHDLPPKVLVVHQFLNSMLEGVDHYDDVPEVEVTIDMDGWGNPYVKLTKYDLYAVSDYSERAAIKLFYHWDVPLLTPARLLSLENPPDLVIYQ